LSNARRPIAAQREKDTLLCEKRNAQQFSPT